MKKWMNYIWMILFLLFLFPAIPASASTDARGELTAKGNDVAVALHIPEGKTETITSLRFRMYVNVISGSMEKPTFRFDTAINSTVQDAAISQTDSGQYIIDLILSGKQDEDIFEGTDRASIGVLSLYPEKESVFTADVGITGEEGITPMAAAVEEGETNEEEIRTDETFYPVVEYVDSSGLSAMNVILYNTEAVTVVSAPGGDEPDEPEQPTTQPGTNTGASDAGPGTGNDSAVNEKPAAPANFKVRYKNTSKVTITWKKVKGATGYQIYRSTKKNGKYKLVKTIQKPSKQKCILKHTDGKIYYYKIRAYVKEAGKAPVNGTFAAPEPARVKKPKVTIALGHNARRITLRWKKTARADGYVVYKYNTKTGAYKSIKVLSGANAVSYSKLFPEGKKYIFKVRAYEWKNKKKKVYGEFSTPVRAVTIPID